MCNRCSERSDIRLPTRPLRTYQTGTPVPGQQRGCSVIILWTHAAYVTPQTNVCEAKHALAQWLAPFRSASWLESDAIQHKVVEQLHTEAHRSALSIVLTQPTVCGCTITRGLPRDETLMTGRETGLYMNDASHPRIAAVMTTTQALGLRSQRCISPHGWRRSTTCS